MIHPHTKLVFINDEVGYGVVATEPIPQGTITWVRDSCDTAIRQLDWSSVPTLLRKELVHFVFPGLGPYNEPSWIACWDHGKYVNHSCEPNCLSARVLELGYEFEVAIRDIAVGEELLDDYGTFRVASKWSCSCGSSNCRGSVTRSDYKALRTVWCGLVLQALANAWVTGIKQPLWSLLGKDRQQISTLMQSRTWR